MKMVEVLPGALLIFHSNCPHERMAALPKIVEVHADVQHKPITMNIW